MGKKYELTNETIQYGDTILYRIRALKDFSDVKVGSLGGFIESEENLSQEGNCWAYDYWTKIFGNAKVVNNAKIESVILFL